MEEQFLIIRMAILDVHLFFLYLVALPEKSILYPLNLQMTKKKKSILEITLELSIFVVDFLISNMEKKEEEKEGKKRKGRTERGEEKCT